MFVLQTSVTIETTSGITLIQLHSTHIQLISAKTRRLSNL